jgi:CDP-diglyceride synthetase
MRLNPGAVSILLLVVTLLVTGIRIDQKERGCFIQAAAVLVLTLTGYFFAYVMTPLDLNYHLMTSLNRLFLQLWPSAVFLGFMAAAIPGVTSPAEGKPEAASLKTKRAPVKGKTGRK